MIEVANIATIFLYLFVFGLHLDVSGGKIAISICSRQNVLFNLLFVSPLNNISFDTSDFFPAASLPMGIRTLLWAPWRGANQVFLLLLLFCLRQLKHRKSMECVKDVIGNSW